MNWASPFFFSLNTRESLTKLFAHINMSAIAGQTAGPNGLTFFEGTHEYPGGNVV